MNAPIAVRTVAVVAEPWIQTLDGGAWDFLTPTPGQVNFRTIAKVLARVPRFAGQTTGGVYSVAQHCVEGARAIERDYGWRDAAAAFLLHDAHEAFIGDDATPKVAALCRLAKWGSDDPGAGNIVRAAFRELKKRADAAIYTAAGIPWPLPADVAAIVREYDARMLRTERDARMPNKPRPWDAALERAEPVVGADTTYWGEDLAAVLYGAAFADLVG